MTLKNPKLFGLNVLSFFADVENKNLSLQNINLPPLDLQVILGSGNAGATRNDWVSFSRLHDPLYETLDRYNRDSSNYNGLLLQRAGTDGALFGNLKINGSLSGNAIRYRYIEGTGANAVSKIADISTSRISAWSSAASPVLPTSPISYGARLTIRSGGQLKFGTATISGPRLQTSIVPQAKEFPSEFPTHKIQTNIGGQTVTLYAMKGIPVIFKGFFRNLDATIQLTNLINGIPASWKIIETGNSSRYSNYTNQGGTTSTINYRSSISRERFIQFYYNPDNILSVTITSANLRFLPAVAFKNATKLEFSYNQLRQFPDVNFIAPKISQLLLRRNPFYLSEFENERKLQNSSFSGGTTTGTVLDKIPTTVKQLYLEGTFNGSITQNIFADRFTGLTVFDVGRGGGALFHPDTADSNNTLPNVPNTLEVYNAQYNDFRAIDASANGTTRFNIKQLTNMISLNLYGNYYLSDSGFSISSQNNVIVSINLGSTGLPFPANISGSTTLETYTGTHQRNSGPLVDIPNSIDYRFDNCSALRSLSLYSAGLGASRFPVFTNINLTLIDLRYTGIKGGAPDGDETYVLPRDTFKFTTNLQTVYIDSGNLLTSPFDPNALVDVTNLRTFWYRSYGRTGGNLPSFGGNPNLSTLWLHHNAFTGTMPNFAANPNIYYVRLSDNKLSGQIPTMKNLSSLYYLFLQNNQFSRLGQFENLPNLRYLYIHNNQITGEIPDFSECPRLYYLIMFNNKFTSYKTGAFKEIYQIRYIDVSDNNLTQQAIEKMIEDLYDSYQEVNRGGITLNLRGNGPPSESSLELITILRSKGWSITHD